MSEEEELEKEVESLRQDLVPHAERVKKKFPRKFKDFGAVRRWVHEVVDRSV